MEQSTIILAADLSGRNTAGSRLGENRTEQHRTLRIEIAVVVAELIPYVEVFAAPDDGDRSVRRGS